MLFLNRSVNECERTLCPLFLEVMMISENEKLLIDYLLRQNRWVKSQELSALLGVSKRMIRNYVKKINEASTTNNYIESSREGYKISIKENIINNPTQISESIEDRVRLVIFKLLTNNREEIHLKKLADELFISEFTLIKTLADIRIYLEDYQITLVRRKGFLLLMGSEQNKRRLMTTIMREELHASGFFSKKQINLGLTVSQQDIEKIIDEELRENGKFINGYMLKNISFHIMIALYRVKEGNSLELKKTNIHELQDEINVANKIAMRILSETGIKLQESEVLYIGMLLLGNISTYAFNELTMEDMRREADASFIEILNTIMDQVYDYYYIDLNIEPFKIQFLLHLKNLSLRISKNQNVKNPMLKEIKNAYPLIYDISVFISNELNKYFNTMLSEDEIAFIALHVGTTLEYQKGVSDKLRTLLICPKYYQIDQQIILKINEHFENDIEIVQVLTDSDYLINGLEQYDLILSTIFIEEKEVKYKTPIIQIKPFLRQKDLELIRQAIYRINNQKSIEDFRKCLENYLPEKMFFSGKRIDNREKALKFLVSQFENDRIVKNDFYEAVNKREALSSTAFYNMIAMPHALKYNANKTTISILIAKEAPIQWGESYVKIVCLIATNENEKRFFNDFFQNFIEILSDIRNVEKIIACNDYKEFVACILDVFS